MSSSVWAKGPSMNERYPPECLSAPALGVDWRLATLSHAPAFASFACAAVMSFSGLMPGCRLPSEYSVGPA